MICSQISPAARTAGLGWIQIAPGGYWLASVRTEDRLEERNFFSGCGLSDLVTTIGALMESLSDSSMIGSA